MFYDGVNRIFFISIPGSGRRSFAVSALHELNNALYHGNTWQLLRIPDKDDEYPDDNGQIAANMRSAEYIDKFRQEDALRGNVPALPDRINLMLRINNNWCGRAELANISGGSEKFATIFRSPAIVVLLDAERTVLNDQFYISRNRVLMEKLLKKADAHSKLHFVLTKADLVNDLMKANNFRGLIGAFNTNCLSLRELCSKAGLAYQVHCTSSANIDSSQVFDPDGSVSANPNIKPYNIADTICSILQDSARIMQKELRNDIKIYNKRIAIRRSIFNSGKMRTDIELDYARKQLCRAIRAVYPSDALLGIVSASKKEEASK